MPEENRESHPGFVKLKIKGSNPKNREKGRARGSRADKVIRRAAKKLAEVLEFADADTAAAMNVLIEQLDSTMPKIRQDAALAILAYKWGRPTEKKITLTGDFDDLAKLKARIEGRDSLQKAVEGKEIDLPVTELPSEDQQAS